MKNIDKFLLPLVIILFLSCNKNQVTTQVHYLLTNIQVFGVLLPSVVY
ncbi:hypothetical protein Belba_2566 [Belliella baltica DSM 15883]|uniref:Lipoprotein n=1 Tax=Belliella baltica (strain DSM 15883 / CIP 108006 / LMG 21964 / BA134) TaxID=866536 RepID=I3Z798_BELBD|nr:hypothetical protein Belba_2566 [Belliella baltica DSM 15883]